MFIINEKQEDRFGKQATDKNKETAAAWTGGRKKR
jgi:hypothetical protein